MEYSEVPQRKEHAYNVAEKREARRKLAKGKAIVAGTVIGLAGLMGVGNLAEKAFTKNYEPDSYLDGKIEVIISPNLNVREAPLIINNNNEPPNTIDWSNVQEINGVKISGAHSFTIEDPLITHGDNPMSVGENTGTWLTVNAEVNQLFGGPKNETLYISLSPATNAYVKTIESGSFIKLNPESPIESLGIVSVNP